MEISEEIAEAIGNARSIGAYNQPIDCKYIGSSASSGNVYHYYKDVDGKYYYESERTLQFEKMIKEKGERKEMKVKNGISRSCSRG